MPARFPDTRPGGATAVAEGGPAALGYRWPAEWEPHAATWLSWPHNPETWPKQLAAVEASFVAMVRALVDGERVCINVGDPASESRVRRLLRDAGVDPDGSAIDFFAIATDDAWVRDHGPIFVVRDTDEARERVVLDFRYDAWGGKYPPWQRDDAVPARIAAARGLPRFAADFVLEGGSVEGDGQGTVLTTETCLLHSNREAGRTREEMERRLAGWLGARQVLWLGGEVRGDDTDGHVDDLARFVAPGVVVAAVEDDPNDVNHAPLADNLRRLRGMRDATGKPLAVATVPMPPPVFDADARCPASYVNFYLANGVALVPVFDAPSDDRAVAVLAELLPDREMVPIPAREMVQGLGAVHCLTQQEPL